MEVVGEVVRLVRQEDPVVLVVVVRVPVLATEVLQRNPLHLDLEVLDMVMSVEWVREINHITAVVEVVQELLDNRPCRRVVVVMAAPEKITVEHLEILVVHLMVGLLAAVVVV